MNDPEKIIHIVDDDQAILDSLTRVLTREGYEVKSFRKPEDYLEDIRQNDIQVAILDLVFTNSALDGESLLQRTMEMNPASQILVISGESDIQRALTCLRKGAIDFLDKPVSLPRLQTSVRNAMQVYHLRASAQERCRLIGSSKCMQNTRSRIRKLAMLEESVLITGESGTGKELVAENLHLFSERFSRPLVKVNCTALNPNLVESELFGHVAGAFTGAKRSKKGYFQQANESTLFIDEIGDFDLSLQAKILRVLQEKTISPVGSTEEVNIKTRTVFATHKNLEMMCKERLFREDLYYRIATFMIHIPPLRDRKEDIPELAESFLVEFSRKNNLGSKSFTEDALQKLQEYSYPGNVRELSNVVKNAAFFAATDRIDSTAIEFQPGESRFSSQYVSDNLTLAESKRRFEYELLQNRLEEKAYDIVKTAESLGILPNNLYRKLKEHHIDWRNPEKDER